MRSRQKYWPELLRVSPMFQVRPKVIQCRDDDIPKSIPIAAVPPSAAPIDHQKPLFDGGRATALSMAPESHRQSSNRSLCKKTHFDTVLLFWN